MRKQNLATLFIIALLSACNLTVYAQQIEINNDKIYLDSKEPGSSFRYLPNGEIVIEKSDANNGKALILVMKRTSTTPAFSIYKNWESPAAFIVYNNGTAYLKNVAVTSDSILKRDINKINSQIGKLKKLRGVSYHWKSDDKQKTKGKTKLTYGLLAQEVEKVYPDMVFTNEEGVKAIFYDELIPILLEAVKEQQAQLDAQEKRLQKLENAVFKNK